MNDNFETNKNLNPTRQRGGRRRFGAEMTENELPLLFLVPLVQTAWAHDAISTREKRVIFDAARNEGVDERSPLNETLGDWLLYQPGKRFFDECLRLIEERLSQMTVKEREAVRKKLYKRCHVVAAASGDARRADVHHFVSREESQLLSDIAEAIGYSPPQTRKAARIAAYRV